MGMIRIVTADRGANAPHHEVSKVTYRPGYIPVAGIKALNDAGIRAPITGVMRRATRPGGHGAAPGLHDIPDRTIPRLRGEGSGGAEIVQILQTHPARRQARFLG